MYYNAQQGVRDTWRDYLQTIEDQVREHNWLPAAVGLIMIAWVALIITGLHQSILVSPHVPDHTQVGNSAKSLTVATVSRATKSSAAGHLPMSAPSQPAMTETPSADTAITDQMTVVAADLPATVTDATNATDGGIVGGKGSDDPTGGVTDPSTDPTPIVTVDPGTGDTTIDTGVELPETPVTDQSALTVDLSLPIGLNP